MRKYGWWAVVAYAIGVLLMTVILRDNKENVLFNIEFTKGYFGGLEASTTKRDALWNVIGFIPFGMLVCLSAKRFNIVLALLTGLFLSETIECLQAIFRKGVFDVNDLIANTIGTVIGCGLYLVKILIGRVRDVVVARIRT